MALAIIFKTLLCLQVYLCLGENTTNFGCCNVTKTALKRFLGLLQFCRHMLPHLAHSVHHRLYALTSTKVDFQWDAAADKAYNGEWEPTRQLPISPGTDPNFIPGWIAIADQTSS